MAFGSPTKSHDERTREELLDMVNSVTTDNVRLNILLDRETERANKLKIDVKESTRAYTLACLTVTHLAKLARGEHSVHRSRPARRVRHPLEGIRP
jgi:hypothetical protein